MMKFVFALVVLLHLCYSYKLNKTLNMEIMQKLRTLNEINKANITIPYPIRVPTQEMIKHRPPCVSVFVRELKHLLDNVTVPEASEHILQELQGNLQVLDLDQKIDHKCRMMQNTRSFKPFNSYINFLMKLNKEKKR